MQHRTALVLAVTFSTLLAACGGSPPGGRGAGGGGSPPGGGSGGAPGTGGGPPGTGGGTPGTGGGAPGSGGGPGGGAGGTGAGTGGAAGGGGGGAGTGGPGSPDGGAGDRGNLPPGGDGGGPSADATAAGDRIVVPPEPTESGVVPVLWITVGRGIPRDSKVAGRMKVIDQHDGTLNGIGTRPAALDVAIGIETRGQSSFNYAQKPYGFEIRDPMGQGMAVPLLGLPPEPDWVLHSCYADKTCMRNALTYAIGRELGEATGRWAPRTRWVEVYIDGDYRGLYLLVERVKRDRARVALPPPAATMAAGDMTGGYIVSQEGDVVHAGEDWTDPSSPMHRFVHRYPRAAMITPAQKTYVQQSVVGLLRGLGQEPRWTDATLARIDGTSWLDYMLMQEVTNNVDAYWKSWFLYRTPDSMGGKWFAGPLWDYDLGYGNVIFRKRYCVTNLAHDSVRAPMGAFWRDASVQNALRCRWNAIRAAGAPLDIARIEAKIESWTRYISTAKTRDNNEWRNIGLWVWPNNYIGASWANEVTYLRYWLRKRLAWLDANLRGTCASVPAPPAVSPIPAPPYVPPRNARDPYPGRDAPDYVPIEGNVGGNLASWACPR